jgi:hypothetical protein
MNARMRITKTVTATYKPMMMPTGFCNPASNDLVLGRSIVELLETVFNIGG